MVSILWSADSLINMTCVTEARFRFSWEFYNEQRKDSNKYNTGNSATVRQNVDAVQVISETFLTLFVKHLSSSVIIILYQQLKFISVRF